MSPNKKVTKEVGYEGAELIAPAIKAAPSSSPHALTMVQHSLHIAIWVVPVGKNVVPKDMETGVPYSIRRTLVEWQKVSDLDVRISKRTILLAAGDS